MINFKNLSFKYAGEENLENVSKTKGEIDNINLHIKKGEFVLLTGLSGCGKTTLIRLIDGLIPSYYEGKLEGSLAIDDLGEITDLHISDISRKVSTVFQNPKSQFFNLETTSELLFYLENIGTPRDKMKRMLDECVELFNIEHLMGKDIHSLSGGEKQIIQIAAAFISGTDIILLDEPTSNLDLKSILKVKEMLRILKKRGKTVVISEHRLYYLKELVDKVYYVKNGRISREFKGSDFFNLDSETRIKLGLREMDIKTTTYSEKIEAIKEKSVSKKPANAQYINIKSLKYKWPKTNHNALDIDNLRLPLGKIIALVGKNGQGKSTFSKALSGLIKAKNDFINYEKSTKETDLNKKINRKERLNQSYVVMQDVGYQLFTDSVDKEISLGSKIDLTLKKDEAINAMNLTEFVDSHPQGLSGGQKQRVSIAAGICSGAKIMFFDEPTSGMDYYHMQKTASYIRSIIESDILFIVITHDMEFLKMVADEVMIMDKGRINPPAKINEDVYLNIYNLLSS